MAVQKGQPTKTERTIGKTTYIVTSHFKQQGHTAAELIRHLLNCNTKDKKP